VTPPAPPAGDETGRKRHGSPLPPPPAAAARRSAGRGTRRATRRSCPRVTPVRQPRAHRVAPERAPPTTGRDRCPLRRAPARKANAAAQARRCAGRPWRAPRAPAALAAAHRRLRASRGSRSTLRRASLRRAARSPERQTRSAPPAQSGVQARRRARRNAAQECRRARSSWPPEILYLYTVYDRVARPATRPSASPP